MHIPEWNTTRVEETPIIPNMRLLFAQFDNGEYIHVEGHDDGATVIWSSALALPEFIVGANVVVGGPLYDGRALSYVSFSDKDFYKDNPMDVELDALARSEDAQFFSGVYPNVILSWREPRVKMLGDNTTLHSEISYEATYIHRNKLARLIGETATPKVVEAAHRTLHPVTQKLTGQIIA